MIFIVVSLRMSILYYDSVMKVTEILNNMLDMTVKRECSAQITRVTEWIANNVWICFYQRNKQVLFSCLMCENASLIKNHDQR
jgi:hypothetical protein